jgi:hypothetical protein
VSCRHAFCVISGRSGFEEDVARRLHEPLSLDDPLALVVEPGAACGRLEHGPLRLLLLEEQRIARVTAEEKHHPTAGPDTPDSYDLPGQVCIAVTPQELASVPGEAREVGGDDMASRALQLLGVLVAHQLVDSHDQRRIGAYARVPVLSDGELRERASVIFAPGLGHGLVDLADLPVGAVSAQHLGQVLRTRPGVPDGQVALAGELAYRLSILGHCTLNDRLRVFGREITLAPGDGNAGRQPLHIPFPRPRKRLVEVVEVEQQLPLRRRESAEVGEMRIAAELNLDPRDRSGRQIGRHDGGGTPKEAEGRGRHAPVADRNQFR